MNWAKLIGELTYTSESGVRVWFSRNNKSLQDTNDIRTYLEFKLSKEKSRSDKGKSRPTPWLNKYKFHDNKESGNCIFCQAKTKNKKSVWNEQIGEEIEIFICDKCTPKQ